MELWEREEFQPVRSLLSSLKDESIMQLRNLNLTKSAEEVKTTTAIIKIQLNLSSMLLELPRVIKEAAEELSRQKEKTDQMRQAGEADFAPRKLKVERKEAE